MKCKDAAARSMVSSNGRTGTRPCETEIGEFKDA
jgi:hypothetical protein